MKDDEIWNRDEIDSPCIRVCVVHPEARICTGCLRSIEEIAEWARMSSEQRTRIIDELPARKPLIQRRRGGRAARLGRQR